MKVSIHPIVKKILRITLRIFAGLLFLLILLILLLRLPFVQNYITEKALSYYSEKVDTPASIGGIYLDFPYNLSISELYLEDKAGDTLLYVDRIKVNTDLIALLGKKLRLDKVSVNGLNGNVHNSPDDERFNYQFIVDAFADTTATAPPDTTSGSSFTFEIGAVEITNSKGTYYDHYYGILADADIGELVAEAETVDLDSPLIDISYLSLRNTHSSVEILEAHASPEDTTSSEPFNLAGEYAEILDTNVDLFVESAGLRMHTSVGQLQVEIDTLDINKQIYLGKNIVLAGSSVEMDIYPTADSVNTMEKAATEEVDEEPFHLVAGTQEVKFTNNSFRMTDHGAPVVDGFDPARLDVRAVSFTGSGLRMEDLFMEGNLRKIHAQAAGGPELVNGEVDFKYGPEEAYVRNLLLETRDSRFAASAELQYPDTSALYALDDNVQASLDIREGKLTLADLYYFVPSLQSSLQEPPRRELRFRGKAAGNLGDVTLSGWDARIDGGKLELDRAHIYNAGDIMQARFEVPKLEVDVEDRLLRQFIGDSIANSYNLPATYSSVSSFQGTLKKFDLDTRISSEAGDVEAWVDFQMPPDSIPVYTVSLRVDSLDVGRILGDTTMGSLGLQAKVDARGISEEELQGKLILELPYARFNSYDYKGLCGEGDLDGFTYNGTLDYRDEFLMFNFNGLASLPISGGRQNFELTLELLDLQGLKLSEEPLAVVGLVNADMVIPPDADPNGKISISQLYLLKDLRLYNLDSVGIEAGENDSLQYVKFDSRFIDMLWQTNFPIVDTWTVMRNHLDHYFNADSTDILLKGDEYFDFSLNVADPLLLTEAILPDLNYIRMEPLKATFDASTSTMDINLKIDSISYLSLAMDSLGFQIHSTPKKLRSDLKIRQLAQGPAVVHHTWLHAQSDIGRLDMMLRFRDPDRVDKYRMGASIRRVGDILEFRADGDSLMLNYHDWKIPDDNLIQLAPSGIWFENFRMTWRDKLIGLESSVNAQSDSVTSIIAENIQLGELTRFNRDSTSIVTGLLDGDIDIVAGEGLPGITADLQVADLAILGEPMGEFEVKSGISSGTVYEVEISLVGNDNNLRIAGDYDTASKDEISLVADIQPLSLKALSIFTSNQLSDVEGRVLGSLNISGSITRPTVNGYLSFEQAGFRITYLQSKMIVNDQRLEVNNNVFRFNNFRMTDENNHEAQIDGQVSTRDFFKYDFDLTAKTNKFTLVNSKKGDNELFYGLLRATSDITIKGNSYLPKVNLNLSLTDDSNFTYVIPEATIQEQMQNDVVRFIDRNVEDQFLVMDVNEIVKNVRDTTETAMTGIDLTASIQVSPENKLQIVIDPITGDQLTIQGEALLNLVIRPTGDINLTGRYQVNSGSYSMNFYGLVQREFAIREGSSIQWTGDPYTARMDVVAEYKSRAAPALQSFKSKLQFVVSLYLKGQILEPEISFGLDLAEDEAAPLEVQSWLAQLNQDEAELNKQVFGLLILNGFFDSGGMNSYDHLAQNTLRSSVSSLLSGELSKLTDQIEGVELSMAIDSYEDYNDQGQSIGRTQLEIGVSKNFFDDRVIVKVAGNFDLEGSNSYRNNVSDFAGDIRIEYKLTEDGRFRLVGFRETNYDDLLQGEIIKTGGGFIYVKNYNAFRELFKKDQTTSDSDE